MAGATVGQVLIDSFRTVGLIGGAIKSAPGQAKGAVVGAGKAAMNTVPGRMMKTAYKASEKSTKWFMKGHDASMKALNPMSKMGLGFPKFAKGLLGKGLGMMGSDLKSLNIPSESEYAELYYKKTGREKIDNWDFYMAYNIFRLAGIAQGIVGRVRDGTASSSEAKNYEAFVPILGKLGWSIVEGIK